MNGLRISLAFIAHWTDRDCESSQRDYPV